MKQLRYGRRDLAAALAVALLIAAIATLNALGVF